MGISNIIIVMGPVITASFYALQRTIITVSDAGLFFVYYKAVIDFMIHKD